MNDDPGSDDDDRYGLLMPFLPVTSKGGPFDDDAYTAGWELGRLDEQLERLSEQGGPTHVQTTIREENAEQADLLAMRHGYTVTVEPAGVEGWSTATFSPTQRVRERHG